ncbi:HAD family hydrolase [Rhodoferax ferrireducens]|uniref:HAD family hydrolase n=1 Tax=Rhodoferax ferrireducens TaxID=192843 RepID=UPI003BB64700
MTDPRAPLHAVEALIFDMDGTMIDSMPSHAQSWQVFARQHSLELDLDDLMRRTTGRNGAECMRELFQRDLTDDEAWTLIAEKERLYRKLFGPIFTEVAGFKTFSGKALARGLKVAVGTAGDQDNIAFVLSHLQLPSSPHAIVGGDEGLPGKPEPAIFLEAAKRMNTGARACIVFEDSPFGIEAARRAGMRAVAICSTHTPAQLAGAHVLASVRDYNELMNSKFLENLHVATS